ncbi:MAG: hypothetical protein GTN49_00310 [candidate division Zixibacteria bacterium]|nr:hypothetical protein [candidate division Zixibacteria bacterium]
MKWLALLLVPSFAFGATVVATFPLSTDTWIIRSNPYWWHVGDTVYGPRNLGTAQLNSAKVNIPIAYTVLRAGGYINMDLRLGGSTVGSFTIVGPVSVGTWVKSFNISPYKPSGTPEVRYYETNQVRSGYGSIVIGRTGGWIDFYTGGVGVAPASFGQIKALYK